MGTPNTTATIWDIPRPFEFTKKYHKKPYLAINPSRPELSAAGKIIFVTGGGTGIGRAIIQGFAQAGAAQVITIGRRKEVLEETVNELHKAFPRTKFYGFPASVANLEDIVSTFTTIRSTIGEPDILVTCAADNPGSWKVLEIPPERIVEAFETNVFGNLTVVREFLKGLTPESRTDKYHSGGVEFCSASLLQRVLGLHVWEDVIRAIDATCSRRLLGYRSSSA